MATGQTAGARGIESELVIIGGGGAGLAAAVTAAELGIRNVVLLEKQGLGGNTAMSGGLFAVESPAQKRAAIDAPRDEVFRQAMEFAHWKSNPRIVREFIDKSGDTIRWLEDKGMRFECVPLYYGQSPLIWHVLEGRTGLGRGAEMTKILASECRRRGVQLLTHAPARKLRLNDKTGRFEVAAASKEGEMAVNAGCVIIATGGYGGNRELLKEYFPYFTDDMSYEGVPKNTGDGLLMAIENGAAVDGLGILLGGGPGSVPPRVMLNIGNPPDTKPVPLGALLREPSIVCVNQRGERFIDEVAGFEYRNACCDFIRASYAIIDQEIVRYITERGLLTGGGDNRAGQRSGLPGLERELRRQADKGFLKIFDSLDGIAGHIGAAPEVLKATIEEYNTSCDKGHDSFLAKDRRFLMPLRTPPYYVIGGRQRGFLDTIGGIKINHHMQILDRHDDAIPGLYAAGVVAGGWQAINYNFLQTSGAACGFAINSGRIAGENAAKYILKEQAGEPGLIRRLP